MIIKRFFLFGIFLTWGLNPLAAQVYSFCEYSPRFIAKHSIKSITERSFKEDSSDIIDSSSKRVFEFGKQGNLIIYHGSTYSQIKYEYDLNNHLIWSCYIDSGGYVSNVSSNIYEGNNLLQKRVYYPGNKEVHKDSMALLSKKPYYTDINTYDNAGKLISTSFCDVSFSDVYDSVVLKFDTVTNENYFTFLSVYPKDTIRWYRTINYIYDKRGNIIREMTTPGSNIYINDSFAYDSLNNMTYKITYNSGDVSWGNARSRHDGEHRETYYKNSYNDKNQLKEIRTYFHANNVCCLRNAFTYDEKGTLRKDIIFKTYPDSVFCGASISGGMVYNLNCFRSGIKLRGIIISDTMFYKEYNEYGELIDEREYCGVGFTGEEGSLFHREFKSTNAAGVMTYKNGYYKNSYYSDLNDQTSGIRTFSFYENGLIREISNSKHKLYQISYTFY